MVISIIVTVDAYLELQKQAFKLKFVEIGKMTKINQFSKKNILSSTPSHLLKNLNNFAILSFNIILGKVMLIWGILKNVRYWTTHVKSTKLIFYFLFLRPPLTQKILYSKTLNIKYIKNFFEMSS